MKTEELAIFGGTKTLTNSFKQYNPIGKEELEAAKCVIESGVLSQFLGSWNPDFYGGPKVQEFEKQCEKYFSVKHAITVNSWTSGLIVAVGAIGIEPGDEVIVSTWTMCASATAILHWNAIPVFADIDPETFCIDPESIEKNITPYTKAIIAVDLFGHSADMTKILQIADEHNLEVISDSAQSPGAIYKGKYSGTLSHIGGYSLNYHKHIHTGEGGILVTDDDELAEKMRLIRNHAEAVVEDKGVTDLANMIGYNFRLGEIECAIGIEQLKKLKSIVKARQNLANKLSEGLKDLPGLQVPLVKPECTHAYYVYSVLLDTQVLGVEREKVCKALQAEGVPISIKFQNLHLLPMYQNKIAYGPKGFPWSSDIYRGNVNYRKGICPVAEKLAETSYVCVDLCKFELSQDDIELIISAFQKVWSQMRKLK